MSARRKRHRVPLIGGMTANSVRRSGFYGRRSGPTSRTSAPRAGCGCNRRSPYIQHRGRAQGQVPCRDRYRGEPRCTRVSAPPVRAGRVRRSRCPVSDPANHEHPLDLGYPVFDLPHSSARDCAAVELHDEECATWWFHLLQSESTTGLLGQHDVLAPELGFVFPQQCSDARILEPDWSECDNHPCSFVDPSQRWTPAVVCRLPAGTSWHLVLPIAATWPCHRAKDQQLR